MKNNILKSAANALAGLPVYCADIYTARDAERYFN